MRTRWAVLVLFGLCIGCSTPTEPGNSKGRECCRIASAPRSIATLHSTNANLFSQAFGWETDSGKALRLEDLNGRCRVMAFFYASCHVTCPITVSKIQGIESALPASLRSQVDFVLITFLPQEDTVEQLAQFRRINQLSDRFVVLRGDNVTTTQFASSLGFGIQRNSAQRSHTPLISLTDRSGKILAQDADLHRPGRPFARTIQTYLESAR